MRSLEKALVAATVFGAVTASYTLPAQAMGFFKAEWASFHGSKPGKPGGGGGHASGGGGGSNRGVPGPVAGAGLSFLLLAGGYALVRRYRSSRPAE